jgi:hypothetical protein
MTYCVLDPLHALAVCMQPANATALYHHVCSIDGIYASGFLGRVLRFECRALVSMPVLRNCHLSPAPNLRKTN